MNDFSSMLFGVGIGVITSLLSVLASFFLIYYKSRMHDREVLMASRKQATRLEMAEAKVRQIKRYSFLILVLFLIGICVTFYQLRRISKSTYMLAENSIEAYQKGDYTKAIQLAMEAVPSNEFLTDNASIALAQRALTSALGVYDLTDGYKPLYSRAAPSYPIEKIMFSPDGEKYIFLTAGGLEVCNSVSSETLMSIVNQPEITDFAFANNHRLIYAQSDYIYAYDFQKEEIIWSINEPSSQIQVASKGEVGAAITSDGGRIIIFDLDTGTICGTLHFDDSKLISASSKEKGFFSLNQTGSKLSFTLTDGSLRVTNLDCIRNEDSGIQLANDEVILDNFNFQEVLSFDGGFYKNNLVCSVIEENNSQFFVIDLDSQEIRFSRHHYLPFGILVSDSGVFVSQENVIVHLDLDAETLTQIPIANANTDIVSFGKNSEYTLVLTVDEEIYIFGKNSEKIARLENEYQIDLMCVSDEYIILADKEGVLHVLKKANHDDANVLEYDSNYIHSGARIASDYSSAMLYGFEGFTIYQMNNNNSENSTTALKISIPDSNNVFDQQYIRGEESDYLEIIYRDGLVRRYAASSGELVFEEYKEAPDMSLDYEFATEDYFVRSGTNGKTSIYDKDGKKLIGSIQEDSYVTNVSQINKYLIIEYLNIAGGKYGVLLDSDCNILSYLPNLCDYHPDGTLFFDDNQGHLRKSRIFMLNELAELGQGVKNYQRFPVK